MHHLLEFDNSVFQILIGLVERTSFRAWTSSMALNENGHIAETDGNKVHHQEEIVIVGGGLGALCFAAALHRYAIIRPSNNYHDLTRIRHQSETIVDRVQYSHGSVWLFLEQTWAEGCGLGKVRQDTIREYCHRSLDQCNAHP